MLGFSNKDKRIKIQETSNITFFIFFKKMLF